MTLTKRTMKRIASAIGASMSMSGMAIAQARDVGSIATDLTDQISSISTMVSVLSFVLGVALAISGLMKFRAHSQNPNDPSNKMSTAFVLIFAGSGLVALPAVLGSGVSTIFGSNAELTNGNSGFTAIN